METIYHNPRRNLHGPVISDLLSKCQMQCSNQSRYVRQLAYNVYYSRYKIQLLYILSPIAENNNIKSLFNVYHNYIA